MHRFPLIDQYLGLILDMDLSSLEPGTCEVVETPRRLNCEQSYGFVHALYGVFFSDGRTAISVGPGARRTVLDLVGPGQFDPREDFDPASMERLLAAVSEVRTRAGLPPTRGVNAGRLFACDGNFLRPHHQGDCRRLRDDQVPPVDGLDLPLHCFPDGIVYGIVADEHVVSVAYAHKTGKMEDRVADLGVDTAKDYRRRGYAQTVVSAVTAQMTACGGEAIYTCSAANHASIATASSVGYQAYARTVVVTAPGDEENE